MYVSGDECTNVCMYVCMYVCMSDSEFSDDQKAAETENLPVIRLPKHVMASGFT